MASLCFSTISAARCHERLLVLEENFLENFSRNSCMSDYGLLEHKGLRDRYEALQTSRGNSKEGSRSGDSEPVLIELSVL